MSLRYFLVSCIALSISFLSSYASTAREAWLYWNASTCSIEPVTHTRAGSHSFSDKDSSFIGIDPDSDTEEPTILTDRRNRLSTSHLIFIDQLVEEMSSAEAEKKLVDGLEASITFPDEKRVCKISISLFPCIIKETQMKMVDATNEHPTLRQALTAIGSTTLGTSQPSMNVTIAKTLEGFQMVTDLDAGQDFSGLCLLMNSAPLP